MVELCLPDSRNADVYGDFTLLVRASSVAEASNSVFSAIEPYVGDKQAGEILRRCRFVCGSLASAAELPARTIDGITHVLKSRDQYLAQRARQVA